MQDPYAFMTTRDSVTQEYIEVDWAMFGELCRALALKVAREYDPEVIVGIARAGVIPGAVIASILRLDFYSMKISRRSGDDIRERPAILSAAPREAEGRRVLIVDEITTSGDTLRLAVPVEGGTVDVRVEDQVLFRGRPTTSGSQLAVRVLSGDQAPSPSMPPAIITPAPASVKPARA